MIASELGWTTVGFPITYQISAGKTNSSTTTESREFQLIVQQSLTAASAGITVFQIREKRLDNRVLHDLVTRCVEQNLSSSVHLIVNERADIAVDAGAAGVHLTSNSILGEGTRRQLKNSLLVGVSTHSIEEVRQASNWGADYILFGPVFETPSKTQYGKPVGLDLLRQAVANAPGIPIIAIGGIDVGNCSLCFENGASGIAAIRMFSDCSNQDEIVRQIKSQYQKATN